MHVVCTDAFAGTEQYVAYVARQQATDGHDVTVLGGSGGSMAEHVGPSVRWSPASSVPRAQRALLPQRPDVVHAHLTAAEIAAVTTKPVHRAPIVATVHLAVPRGGGRPRGRLYRLIPRHLDAQIAISHFVAERSGVGTAAEVIPDGVPWDLPERPRQPQVLVAQRLEPEKDTATAIRAWARSGLGDAGWRMVVAGEGSERAALEQLIAAQRLASSVELIGFVPDVKRRMTEAGIFLATTPADGLGLSVIESMAAGTPVVAAAGGGHLETVALAGDTGLFPPGDPEGCATVLRRLADDPDGREAYGRALREVWAAQFTLERHTERLEAVYRRVVR